MEAINEKSFKDTIQSTLEANAVSFNNSDTSSIFSCGGATIVSLFTTTAAIDETLEVLWSIDGVTFFSCIDATGADIDKIALKSNKVTLIASTDLLSYKYVKFVATQAITATVSVVTRRIA